MILYSGNILTWFRVLGPVTIVIMCIYSSRRSSAVYPTVCLAALWLHIFDSQRRAVTPPDPSVTHLWRHVHSLHKLWFKYWPSLKSTHLWMYLSNLLKVFHGKLCIKFEIVFLNVFIIIIIMIIYIIITIIIIIIIIIIVFIIRIIIGSIVYNGAIVYKCQNFLKVVVHVWLSLTNVIKSRVRWNPGNGYLQPRCSCHCWLRVICKIWTWTFGTWLAVKSGLGHLEHD